MQRIYHRARFGLAAVALACGCMAVQAAVPSNSFTPQSGTWIVNSELDGNPGRGLAIDVQDGIMVMQVYNYRADGTATFHVATGNVVNNQVTALLKRYRGGRFFGSGPQTAVDDGDAGAVQITFTSGSSGTVQFPGESPVTMQRYRFENAPDGQLNTKGWMLALLNEKSNAVAVTTAFTGLDGTDINPIAASGTGMVILRAWNAQTQQEEDLSLSCVYAPVSYTFRCQGINGTVAAGEFKEYVRQLTGTLQWSGKTYRMVGQRLIDYKNDGLDTDIGIDTDVLAYAPDDGTWIVSDELDGKPGRGLAIDTQGGTLTMQVYNYDAAGNATFHLAVGSYANGQAQGSLKRYAGGRYFGSGPRSGVEAADAGPVYLAFNTPTTGVVRFPGEPPHTIQRYRFGAQAPSAVSLLGTWAMYDATNQQAVTFNLSQWAGGTAVSADGMQCSYTDTVVRKVRCTQTIILNGKAFYSRDYRFVVDGNLALGKALPMGWQVPDNGVAADDSLMEAESIKGLRVADQRGVQTGLGPLR